MLLQSLVLQALVLCKFKTALVCVQRWELAVQGQLRCNDNAHLQVMCWFENVRQCAMMKQIHIVVANKHVCFDYYAVDSTQLFHGAVILVETSDQ